MHILNNDLSSAHFLCRHMQVFPAWEGIVTQRLLHQIESDYRNAETWYGSVKDGDCFVSVWPGGLQDAVSPVQDVERLKKDSVGDEIELTERSWKEIDVLAQWCRQVFGTERVLDATPVWIQPVPQTRDCFSHDCRWGRMAPTLESEKPDDCIRYRSPIWNGWREIISVRPAAWGAYRGPHRTPP